ncbi:MAG: lipase family protein [Planctomycetota bacterium]
MQTKQYFDGVKAGKAYDQQTSLSLAAACALAYESKSKIGQTIAGWQWTEVAVVSKRKGRDIDTQCFIMEDDRNLVVAFRGSDALPDWIANFQATRDPGPLHQTKAHEGFQDALYPAVMALTHHVRSGEAASKRVWVTGHSLGGALASLYAGMLTENGVRVYGLYTFASPRPGNEAFASALKHEISGPHYRVVNDGDVVPHLPPEPFFSHPGNRVILKPTRIERDKPSWWRQRVAALSYFVKATGKVFRIADHHKLAAGKVSYIPRLVKDLNR